jgi:predicted PurR-regulated permease PerM
LSILVGLAAVLVIVNDIGEIRNIVAASFLALNLVLVVWPIQSLLARFLPRIIAAIVAGCLAVAVLMGLLWSIGWSIAKLVQALPAYSAPFTRMITNILTFADNHNIKTNYTLDEIFDTLSQLNVGSIVSSLSSVASGLGSAIWLIALIVMILIFMMMDSTGFGDRVSRLAERHSASLAWALTAFARGVRRYWIVAAVFGLIVAFCDWVLLIALGVPLALVWAVFSFVTNFIPNIGFVLGLLPPVIMAVLDKGPMTALWVAVGYTILNVVIQSFIQPRITGEAVGITATVAVLSLLLWATVLGPLGAILAIPATLLMKTLFVDSDPQARWLNTLIAANPGTSDEDPIKLSQLLDRAKRLGQPLKRRS